MTKYDDEKFYEEEIASTNCDLIEDSEEMGYDSPDDYDGEYYENQYMSLIDQLDDENNY